MNRIFLALLLLTFLCSAQAKLVQILHTNDIHSYIDHSAQDPNMGGYAAIKFKADELKREAKAKGIPTLFLDGGDFLEGNLLYKSDNGKNVFDIVSSMGYDGVVIGNHDWLMGTEGLDQLIGRAKPTFPILAANLRIDEKYKNINETITPYKEFDLDGVRVAVLGIATNSLFYSWRVEDGKIKIPILTTNSYAKKLKKKGNDFIIALSHLGHNSDQNLIRFARNIDIVVGGHGHDFVSTPTVKKSLDGKNVPILQAGEYGKVMGRMLVDLTPGKPLKVVSYELVPIFKSEGEDQEIVTMVQKAKDDLVRDYGEDYLNEILGYSKVDLINSNEVRTLWGDFVADSFKEAIDADVAIHSPKFTQENIKAGPITRYDIMKSYPRFFELDRDQGSSLYSGMVKGWLLKLILNVTVNSGYPLHFSGVKFELNKGPFSLHYIKNVKVNGKRLKRFKSYQLVVPEVAARGGLGVTSLLKIFFKHIVDEQISVWSAIEQKIVRTGVIEEKRSSYGMMVPAKD